MTCVTAMAARDALRVGRVLPCRFEVEYVAADSAVCCGAAAEAQALAFEQIRPVRRQKRHGYRR